MKELFDTDESEGDRLREYSQ